MPFVKSLLILVLVAPAVMAQSHFSHPVQAFPDPVVVPERPLAAPDTVRLLAVRVQFATDADAGTTGDGHFDLQATADSTLDAPPYDARYFRDHLLFLENYYRKVSRGKTVVRTTLLDSVVTLPALMSAYSPARDAEADPVAALARDTWRAVDSLHLVPAFGAYDCFLIFHAGVGRDVDLVSSLGYDPGPRDIPSLTFGLEGFRKVFGSGFTGFPVEGGVFRITNSLVLPSTERRLLPGPTGDAPLILSINGLLCASMGSYLGLPDLFNTATGRSGIGRFGLMDGQAIFSFAGAFPPEPSAWEKFWLGWTEPIPVTGSVPLVLPAIGFGSLQPSRRDTVYRVPLSPTEYVLVENRNRDPEQNGQRVSMSIRGALRNLQVRHDTDDFYAYDVSALRGVVTDVEDFDWSLPGAYNKGDSTFFDGGVLLWHIDDVVLRERLGANAVNADPGRRGIDLEEADGSQDIGESYAAFTAGSGSEEGTFLDFWYRGNASPVNTNAFSPVSHPDSRTNTGAATGVSVRAFSLRGPRMSCVVEQGVETIRRLPGFPKRTGGRLPHVPLAIAVPQQGNGPVIVVGTSGMPAEEPLPPGTPAPAGLSPKVFGWKLDGTALLPGGRADGLCDSASGPLQSDGIAIADADGDGTRDLILLRSGERSLLGLSLTSAAGGLSQRLFSVQGLPIAGRYPMVTDSAFFVAATALHRLGKDGIVRDSLLVPGDTIVGVSRGLTSSQLIAATAQGKLFLLTGGAGGAMQIVRQRDFGGRCCVPPAAGFFGAGAPAGGAVALILGDGTLYLTDGELNTLPGFPVSLGEPASRPPAIADVDGDGRRDLVIATSTRLHVLTLSGARADGFPVQLSDSVASAPVVGDCDGDGRNDIVVVTKSGVVAALTGGGSMLTGFPLAAGVGEQWPAVVLSGDSIALVVASSSDGSVSAWRTGVVVGTPRTGTYPWAQFQRDAERSGSELTAPLAPVFREEFFPDERVYNWPNPVYDGRTFLRYYLRADAEVRINIYDLAGDQVASFAGPGSGGMDNEIVWDVSGIASGIYFAHIEANGAGVSGKAIVKVAVVK